VNAAAEAPTVALVGCGRWGVNILRDLRRLGCTVPVVARSGASIERAKQAGATAIVESVASLDGIDGAVVATPTTLHAAVLEELLPFGVPLFVEKPLTASRLEAERLAEAAPEHLFVMDKWRYHPGVEALRDIARSGELGRTVGVATTREGWGSPYVDVDSIWIHLPHDLAIGLEILGELPKARSAVAEVVGGVGTGMHAVLGGGEAPWLAITHSVSTGGHRRVVRLCGSEGSAWLADGYATEVVVSRGTPGEAERERRPVRGEWPLFLELEAFVRHLAGAPPPRSSAGEGAAIVRRIAELRELAGLGR
jgi:predicted dehydrogenase